MTPLEIAAVVFTLANVWLAVKENIWTWPAGLVSVTLYLVVFWRAHLYLNAWLQPENGHADVFVPISVQTERNGHYTNFEGTVSEFRACFAKKAGVAHAEEVFAALATRERVAA